MRPLILAIIVLLLAMQLTSAEVEQLPVQRTATFDASNLSDFRLSGQRPNADYSFVAVAGQSFDRAIRVQVATRTPKPWDVQILSPPSTVPLKKGDHLLAILHVRCTAAPESVGIFNAFIQASESPWTKIASTDVAVGNAWKRIFLHARTAQDYAAGKYEISLFLGSQAQTLEFGGFALFNLGANVDVGTLPFTPITYPGQEANASWRKAAAARIEQYRKGNLTVRVVDRDGKPVSGAKIRMQMLRHAYGFGTVMQYPDTDKLREWTLKLFNRCTAQIYWSDWGWANLNTRAGYLASARWAYENKMAIRGHCIIYPGWQFLPGFVKPLAQDPPALRKRLLEQVAEVTDATRQFNFTEYDVCNELRDLKDITGVLGRDAVVEWFKVAREHAPHSRMALNENTILTHGGVTQAEQDNYAEWIQYLIDQGQGPDVIGMQGHFGDAVTAPETVVRILDRFAKFGKAIQITEFDLSTRDEQGQARYLRDFLTAVFSHPATDAFIMWGFWEGKMWLPQAALIRKDWTLKPNGQAWMDLVLKEWWTDVTLVTGPDGSCATRGFLGDYRIIVTVDGKEKSVLIQLAKPAAMSVVALN